MSYLGTRKRQFGVSKERLEEGRRAGHASGLAANDIVDLADVIRSEVGEPTVLEVAPDLLLGVEFRGIAGQPDRVPAAVTIEVGPNELVLVGVALVPEQEQVTGVVAAELA
jgi:hypothetical protein